jgi:hypothetical protein
LTESEGIDKGVCANGNKKTAEVAILISDELDYQSKSVTRTKEVIKGSVHQEDIIIANINIPNIRSPK